MNHIFLLHELPQVGKKGTLELSSFPENRHGNNQSIDSGYKKIIKVVTWTAGLNK